MPVEVVHWNPLRPQFRGPLGKVLPRRGVNNFGDLLGPLIVQEILRQRGVSTEVQRAATGRIVAVGSIMKLTLAGDVVWGAGVNGKSREVGAGADLDVRAVRGPLTAEQLRSSGAKVPAVYGDPALLWSRFWPRGDYLGDRASSSAVTIVPNLHDWPRFRKDPRAVSPQGPVHEVAAAIARSEFVCGSSLHGIVLAESFGIPARLIEPGHEPSFKYVDYYRGTGRARHEPAISVEDAIRRGGEPTPDWSGDELLSAFPIDMWQS